MNRCATAASSRVGRAHCPTSRIWIAKSLVIRLTRLSPLKGTSRHFQPDAPPFRLTTSAERARVLATHGVDRVYEIRFDAELAAMSAEDFAASRAVINGDLLKVTITVTAADA